MLEHIQFYFKLLSCFLAGFYPVGFVGFVVNDAAYGGTVLLDFFVFMLERSVLEPQGFEVEVMLCLATLQLEQVFLVSVCFIDPAADFLILLYLQVLE